MSIPSAAQKVIYQYTLVKKVRRNRVWSYMYGIVLPAFGLSLHMIGYSGVWLVLAFSMIVYLLIEFVVTAALCWARPEWGVTYSRLGWMLRFPWIGYFPQQEVSFRSFRMIQTQVFFTAGVVSGIASAWLGQYGAVAAAVGFLWCAFPRLWLLFTVRKAAKKTYLIRFDAGEVSIYAS